MNKFCRTCPHRLISNEVKEKFNELIKETFLECPIDDENVAGCTIKFLDIDWDNFREYLKKKKIV